MAEKQPTVDQLGVKHDPDNEVMEAKNPTPPAEVPGVRGPINPPGEQDGAQVDPRGRDEETFGDEGGAGAYPGSPTFSEAEVPPKGSGGGTWARAKK
jgi:hypothetical protein